MHYRVSIIKNNLIKCALNYFLSAVHAFLIMDNWKRKITFMQWLPAEEKQH